MPELSRRNFLRLVAAAGGAALPVKLSAQSASAGPNTAGAPPPVVYLSLSPDEAAFTEALVNVLCPADHLTPAGVDCGLAFFIDRQLAGPFGRGDRLYRRGPYRPAVRELGYQLPLTPEQYFKAGVAAADAACKQLHGSAFSVLAAAEAEKFLQSLAAGEIPNAEVPLGVWFDTLVYPLFIQGCYSDPLYGGNKDKVFWKMIGYPGLPAAYAEDMVRYRGKPHPGAQAPKSMEDFS
jgi:gluconate 2-dehydrogenase gamma chain